MPPSIDSRILSISLVAVDAALLYLSGRISYDDALTTIFERAPNNSLAMIGCSCFQNYAGPPDSPDPFDPE